MFNRRYARKEAQLRRQCEEQLQGIEISDPYAVDEICRQLAVRRGRPLHLHELPDLGGVNAPCGLMISFDSCLPPLSVAVEYVRSWIMLRRLQPLWKRLADAAPHVVLSTSVPKRRVGFRLERCVIEIEDACLALREYVSADVRERARALAFQKGVSEQEVDAVSEAAWLRVAASAARTGKQLEGVEHPPLGVTGRDRPSELAWLHAVSRADASSPVVAEFTRQEVALASLSAGGPGKDSSHDN
ncbi:MAB_1171c family putative transporter [Streptomyces scabiei]|uniref:MAB_1171c family putative transporter n=1 Tax=Streptomyces scabiei TaxID=1930 RepID=UPI0038F7E463